MDSFFFRFKNALVLIAIVLLQVLALAIQVQRPLEGSLPGSAPDGRRITLLRRWAVALVTPVERLSHATGLHTRHVWDNYLDLRGARVQNEQLRLEVTRLREEQASLAENAAEGRRLETILGFQQKYIAKTIAAQVIGTSGSDRSHVLYLDKGWADGLRPNQPVITPYGVVGKLRDVFPRTSQLLLINDSSSGAGVILESSRIRGIIRGTANGEVEINNLTQDSRIKPGEKVITSGGDEVFPRGLPVGMIASVAPDPQHQPFTAIVIKPAADLTRLEEVLVITQTTTTMPAAMQADAAQAEATAAEEKRAADVLAERLPSIQADVAANSPASDKGKLGPDGRPLAAAAPASTDLIGGLPGVPNSGMPRVRPSVHPDRYTAGTTPPAADLTPGAEVQPIAVQPPSAGVEAQSGASSKNSKGSTRTPDDQ